MYGLVNKAIQDMVCDRFGEETWEEIKKKAQLDVDVFISMDGYPDDVTHRLVKAASEILAISSSEILQAFGEYWVLYTAKEGYGEMMDMAGENLPEFLQNLDSLHARLGLTFPQLQPPSFDCTEIEDDSLNLHYQSTREGLAAMVIGLVKGLGARFNTEVDIKQTSSREQGSDRDEFSIDYKENE